MHNLYQELSFLTLKITEPKITEPLTRNREPNRNEFHLNRFSPDIQYPWHITVFLSCGIYTSIKYATPYHKVHYTLSSRYATPHIQVRYTSLLGILHVCAYVCACMFVSVCVCVCVCLCVCLCARINTWQPFSLKKICIVLRYCVKV
jgi:hypothetical protein